MSETDERFEKARVLEALINLKDRWDNEPDSVTEFEGICDYLECTAGIFFKNINVIIRDLAYTWKHFSGHAFYPVPSPDNQYASELRRQAARSMFVYTPNYNKWDTSGQYGKRRYDFLVHCIKTLQGEFND